MIVGVPLLVSAAVTTALVTLFQPMYLINDDTTLSALANGDYTGRRTSSLVVAPAMFGHLVRLGYALLPHLPWYGISLYVLEVVAWAVIGTVAFALRRRLPLAERLVVAAVIVALAPWMILRVSFTPAALFIGAVGIIAFAVSTTIPGRAGYVCAAIAGVLLGTACLVRVYSFLGVVIAFAPVLGAIAFKAGIRRSAAFALAVGVLGLVTYGTNHLEYSRSPEWSTFIKTNAARSALQATPRLNDHNVSDSDLQRIGWTRNDLHLFAEFFDPDPHVYTDQDIRTLAVLSPRVRAHIRVRAISRTLRDTIAAPILAIGALLALRWGRSRAAATLVSVVWLAGVLVALVLYVRLPDRVLIPLETGAALMAAIVPAYLTPRTPRTQTRLAWTSIVATGLAAVLLAGTAWYGVHSTRQLDHADKSRIRTTRTMLAKLEAFDPKGVFVGRGDDFGMGVDPLSVGTPFANPRLIPLGWAVNSPVFTARLARVGIRDLYTAMATNPHVYLLGSGIEARHMSQFYRQHRHLKVRFVPVLPGVLRTFGLWSAVPAGLRHPGTPIPAR